jgi:DNA-binding NtrC family response regulator
MSPESGSSAEELLERARAAAQRATAAAPIQGLAGPDAPPWTPLPAGASGATVAKSPALLATLDMAGRVAKSALPVLLQGETGSGKEVVARFLHERGRADRPLVTLNCAAIPDSLVESVLFGHEKGAFTGATRDQKGVFEAADGGTLLLDEIGELPLEAQAALLRVLETKRLMRVGSTREISVDVRIVAATHRDLEAAVTAGRFREDLLFRLNGVSIRVPPLRERPEDLEPLITRFVAMANAANGRDVRGVDPEALALLAAYPWPGNVRELHNAMERAVVIAGTDLVTLDDLPERIRRTAPATAPALPAAAPDADAPISLEEAVASLEGDFRTRMERLEVVLLTEALREASWNQTETARRLQMPLRTLVHKLKMLGIRRP